VFNGTHWINAPPPTTISSGPAELIYNQATPLLVWDIIHNMNGHPNVTITDLSNELIQGDVDYISLNELTITFSPNPISGTAYLV